LTSPKYEDPSFLRLFSRGELTQSGLNQLKKIDQFNVFKNWTNQKLTAENHRAAQEMEDKGFGLIRTNCADSFGVQVADVEKWMAYMVLVFEKENNTKVRGATILYGRNLERLIAVQV
jgi:hypothetical protein